MKTNPKMTFTIVVLLTILLSILPSFISHAQKGSDNYTMNPSINNGKIATLLDTWVNVGTTIQGSSSNVALGDCSSSVSYWWDYQNNILQASDLGNSWIQQVLEVGNIGSCYSVWFFPDYYRGAYDYHTVTLYSYPTLWYTSGNEVEFEIAANSPLGSQATVTEFTLNGYGANSIGDSIVPSQLNNNPTIIYDSSSQQDFNIVGTEGGAYATFTSGGGGIQYCQTTPTGNTGIQTGEDSNMGYSTLQSISQADCDGYLLGPYTQQQFDAGKYYLTMNLPYGGSPNSGWYLIGSNQQISAGPGPCDVYTHPYRHYIHYYFSSWSGSGTGSYNGSNNPASITMNGPITQTANYNYNTNPC